MQRNMKRKMSIGQKIKYNMLIQKTQQQLANLKNFTTAQTPKRSLVLAHSAHSSVSSEDFSRRQALQGAVAASVILPGLSGFVLPPPSRAVQGGTAGRIPGECVLWHWLRAITGQAHMRIFAMFGPHTCIQGNPRCQTRMATSFTHVQRAR
jgi:hypothetical protein